MKRVDSHAINFQIRMLPAVFLRSLGLLAYLSAAGVLTSLSLTCQVGILAEQHGATPKCTLCDCIIVLSQCSLYLRQCPMTDMMYQSYELLQGEC